MERFLKIRTIGPLYLLGYVGCGWLAATSYPALGNLLMAVMAFVGIPFAFMVGRRMKQYVVGHELVSSIVWRVVVGFGLIGIAHLVMAIMPLSDESRQSFSILPELSVIITFAVIGLIVGKKRFDRV